MRKLNRRPEARPWSHAARKWQALGTYAETAKNLYPPVGQSIIGLWATGLSRTPAARVVQLIALANSEGVHLTPGDFGRPDLAPTTTEETK